MCTVPPIYTQSHDQINPILSAVDVYCKTLHARKPNSSVPGDIPKKFVQHFAPQIAVPAAVIFNAITVYPDQWKVQHQLSVLKSRKHDFPPKLNFLDKMELEVEREMKLVGFIVSKDLKWEKNTDYKCNKASQKLWILSGISKQQSKQIENNQKVALRIIL